MSQINLNELEKKAQAATPGPWCATGVLNSERATLYRAECLIEPCIAAVHKLNADAAFIAACSPDVILALVARVRELEQVVREQNPAVILDSSVSVLLVESLREESKKLVARVRELQDALEEYGEHTHDCVLACYQGGEPTADGGYRVLYRDVWYEVRPKNMTPKCECGFDKTLTPSEPRDG